MRPICLLVQSVYDFDPRVRRKAEALVAAGYSVDVLGLRPESGEKDYVLNGVHVSTIALGKKRGSLARYAFEYVAFFCWAMLRLPLLMRRRQYAVIDVNTLPDFLVFAPFIARWMGARIVLDMHEITAEFYISKYGIAENSWIVRLLKLQERVSFNFADRVITINEPVEDLLVSRGLPREKCLVMMNAADDARFASFMGSDTPASPDKFIMVYHGTLTRLYGLDVAINAFALAQGEMPEAELWILGSGPEQISLAHSIRQHGLESKVKLLGQVPSAEIPAWLGKTHVGVLPIRKDALLDFAFPNKLPEYIIMGKPVIISRLRAIRHYFGEASLAFAEPNDAKDLARQMLCLYRDPELRETLAANARIDYAPIRWDVMKRRYLDVIGELSGPAGRHASAAVTTTPLIR
jgi:glycosyltransferase involved in cell wall biosynthesis